jgi:hypothetical protein
VVCASEQLYVWVQYMGHFVYTEYKLRTSPRKHKYTSRQKLFMVAIGCCHVGAFLLFLPAVDKIGVALYQIIYSSGMSSAAVHRLTSHHPAGWCSHSLVCCLSGRMALQGC